MNKEELTILRNQLDKAIDEILNIDEDLEREGKMIYPVYRLTVLKNNINKLIEGAGRDERYEVKKAIRNIR